MKLALGTVQFGMDYGLARLESRTPDEEVCKIMSLGSSRGMDLLDTATSYGDCEALLGRIGLDNWRVVTKITSVPEDSDPESWIRNALEESLSRLKLTSVYGLLLHQPGQLLGKQGDKIWSTLCNLKAEGLISKPGVSIYSPDELAAYFDVGDIEIVQAPVNLLDRRLVKSGWLERMEGKGVEVHARSVFLQGLLLMEDANRPEKFNRWSELWQQFGSWLSETGLSRMQACMAYVNSLSGLKNIIVGVNNAGHLENILDSADCTTCTFPETFSSEDPFLINPLGWLEI